MEELSDLHEVLSALGGHPILLGVFNCPGNAPHKYDTRLVALLSCYELIDLNVGPTRVGYDGSVSWLNAIAEPCHPRRLTGATTTLVGFSDHRLLSTTLGCTRPAAPTVTDSYRVLKRLDVTFYLVYQSIG
jgi:hypothetical protein